MGKEEKHRCEKETPTCCLLYSPRPGTEPASQACALTRNQTGNLSGDLLLCKKMPKQLSYTGQD